MERTENINILIGQCSDSERIIQEIFDFLQPGGRIAVLIGPQASGKTASLEKIGAMLSGDAIKVANPLISPITLDRFLFQIGGTGDEDDEGEAIVKHLVGSLDPSTSTTLIVDDAHSLHPDVWPVLARVPGLHIPDGPRMNLIIATRPDGPAIIDQAAAIALHDPSHSLILRLGELNDQHPPLEHISVTIPFSKANRNLPVKLAASEVRRENLSPAARKRSHWLILFTCVVAAGLLTVALTRTSDRLLALFPVLHLILTQTAPIDSAPASSPAVAPSPPLVPNASAQADTPDTSAQADSGPYAASVDAKPFQAPAPSAPSQFPAPPTLSRPVDAQLRSEFEAFLRRAGRDTAALPPDARDALFQEYLRWRDQRGVGLPKTGGQ